MSTKVLSIDFWNYTSSKRIENLSTTKIVFGPNVQVFV